MAIFNCYVSSPEGKSTMPSVWPKAATFFEYHAAEKRRDLMDEWNTFSRVIERKCINMQYGSVSKPIVPLLFTSK